MPVLSHLPIVVYNLFYLRETTQICIAQKQADQGQEQSFLIKKGEEMSMEKVVDDQSAKLPWHQIWLKAYISPKTETYDSLIQGEPKDESTRATVWIGVSALITGLIPLVLYWVSNGNIIHDDLADSGVLLQGGTGILFFALSIILTAMIIAPLLLYISASILHGIAIKFGGEGLSEKLLFLIAAITAPAYLVDATVEGLFGDNIIGLGIRLILIFYQVILIFVALKSVYKLPNRNAAGVVGIAGLLVTILAGCLIAFFFIA